MASPDFESVLRVSVAPPASLAAFHFKFWRDGISEFRTHRWTNYTGKIIDRIGSPFKRILRASLGIGMLVAPLSLNGAYTRVGIQAAVCVTSRLYLQVRIRRHLSADKLIRNYSRGSALSLTCRCARRTGSNISRANGSSGSLIWRRVKYGLEQSGITLGNGPRE